ncbi:MAG TPA: hypothetical protein VNO22_01160 [Planctomycetota bacterium]|nr:hypothetical protein [Planctomycetota bacterium]
MKRRLLLAAGPAACLGGCTALGQTLGAVGQIVDLAIALALAAAPFALSYYLWRRSQDD